MSASVEIVTHCYCPPGVDQYAEYLRWQFASLVRWARDLRVTWTVCFTRQDPVTTRMIEGIETALSVARPGLLLRAVDLEPAYLFRRAIGRNFRALETLADVVWFTDVDYLFGLDCLATVLRLVAPTDGLRLPAEILIHRDHATGDADVAAARGVLLPAPDPTHFLPRRQRTAIGGVQIVGGDTARERGYCRDSKWVEPVDPAAGFRSCKCDRAYRRLNGFRAVRLPIPNVYRLRHGTDGRDFTADGRDAGREVW